MLATATAATAAAVTGCSAPEPARATEPPVPAAAGTYWTVARLLSARAWQDADPAGQGAGRVSSSAHTALAAARVGALFLRTSGGNHFCTASVVSSPGRDLLITAAHCINGGKGSGYRSDIVFIPGYRDGTEPYGIWSPARLLVAPGWARSADPDLDVGFVVLKPRNGENIERVLGADILTFNTGYRNLVRVTDFNSATRTGRIIGVIGGYEQGGDTASVSYSPYFGTAIKDLYDEAITG
jgi:hypothetical protein